MLRIRLTRVGKKKQPQYRIVVMERTQPRDSDYLEVVGHYDPRRQPAQITLKPERLQYWLAKGAQPTDTVRSFLRRHKLV